MSQQQEVESTSGGAVGQNRALHLTGASLLSNEKRVILGFQVVVSIAVLGAYISRPAECETPWQFYVAAAAFVVSSLVFVFEPGKTFDTSRSQFLILFFSLAMLATSLLLLGLSQKEFYLVLLLTVFMSAISKKAPYAFMISVVMGGVYVVFVLQNDGGTGLASSAFLIRMVVFFVVSSFVGHVSEMAEVRKQDVEQLTDWKKKLEAFALEQDKMAAVGLLAAGVAHEFNNLLAGIQGYADLARIDAVSHEELVDVVSTQCRRAAGIVRDLLSFSRQKGDTPVRIDMAEVIEQTLRLVHKELGAREVSLVKDISCVRAVRTEPGVLDRTMLNLVSNAMEAVERGGEITVALYESDDRAVLEVRDNGRGMSAEDLAQAFEPFCSMKRGDADKVARAPGLGLAVSKHLIEKCGGTIEIKSALASGTSVIIRLPMIGGAGKQTLPRPPSRTDCGAIPGQTREPFGVDVGVVANACAKGEGHDV
ncbi:MAG: sensor histidine kinase [Planctomycetota bacterium]